MAVRLVFDSALQSKPKTYLNCKASVEDVQWIIPYDGAQGKFVHGNVAPQSPPPVQAQVVSGPNNTQQRALSDVRLHPVYFSRCTYALFLAHDACKYDSALRERREKRADTVKFIASPDAFGQASSAGGSWVRLRPPVMRSSFRTDDESSLSERKQLLGIRSTVFRASESIGFEFLVV